MLFLVLDDVCGTHPILHLKRDIPAGSGEFVDHSSLKMKSAQFV